MAVPFQNGCRGPLLEDRLVYAKVLSSHLLRTFSALESGSTCVSNCVWSSISNELKHAHSLPRSRRFDDIQGLLSTEKLLIM